MKENIKTNVIAFHNVNNNEEKKRDAYNYCKKICHLHIHTHEMVLTHAVKVFHLYCKQFFQ